MSGPYIEDIPVTNDMDSLSGDFILTNVEFKQDAYFKAFEIYVTKDTRVNIWVNSS